MYSVKNSVSFEKLCYFCGAEIYLCMYIYSRYNVYFIKELILLERYSNF